MRAAGLPARPCPTADRFGGDDVGTYLRKQFQKTITSAFRIGQLLIIRGKTYTLLVVIQAQKLGGVRLVSIIIRVITLVLEKLVISSPGHSR